MPHFHTALMFCLALTPACGEENAVPSPPGETQKATFVLDYGSTVDPALQLWLENLDAALRKELDMEENDTSAGILDLRTGRLALVRADQEDYAASVAKIGILLAWFETHPEAPGHMEPQTARELGEMAKISSNEMAAKFSREIGLKKLQAILEKYGFYDAQHGGGLWVGRHYGKSDERYGDPLHDHSHAATVRQILRFFLLMEQGQLLSPEASAAMQKIFDTPDLPHDNIKFVKALTAKDPALHIRRKWGSWENWLHDSAVVTGPGRHYILASMTHHPRGDEYLEKFATAVDGHLAPTPAPPPSPRE